MKNPISSAKFAARVVSADSGRREFLRNAGLIAMGGVAGSLMGCGGAKEPAAEATTSTAIANASPAEQALISAAQKERKLMLYSGSEESIITNLGKAFQRNYGVSLEYQRLSSNEIAARYTAEAQAGRTVADLVLTGDHELFEIFGQKGWLGKIDPAAIPRLSEWPQDYRDEYTATVSIVPYSIALNTDKVKTIPVDWKFLLSPEVTNSIVTLDAKRVNLVAIAGWDFLLTQYGDDFLKQVGQQRMKLVDSGPSAVQQLASGAAKAYFPCSLTQAQSMISQGAPVKTVVPEGAPFTGVLTQAGMSAGATSPNAAKLFLSFLLTEEGQKILNVVGSSPVNTPGTPPLRSGFVKPNFASTAANKAKIIQLLGM